MNEFDLQNKFPDLKPIKSAPGMFTLNGIGTNVYGRRDFDDETWTYVKTLCVCFVFIPIFALSAYRVADAQRGWIFLGRVPLSGFAKLWNCFLVLALVGGTTGIFWLQHINSADYIARSKMAEASEYAKSGDVVKAAGLYRDVALGRTSQVSNARQKLQELVTEGLETTPPKEAAQVITIAVDLRIEDVAQPALKLAKKHAADDAEGALALLEAVSPVVYGEQTKTLNAQRRELLEKMVQKKPQDLDTIIRLALAYEAEGRRTKIEKLLRPHKDKLGTGEGARLLGQIYARQNKLDDALALLLPYTEERLESFKKTYRHLADIMRAREKALINQLRNRKAPGFPYDRYKNASRAEQDRLVNEYFDKELLKDQSIKEAREAVRRESAVVPAALDVGLLLLRRAQKSSDAKARKLDLQRAEKTFLAIGAVAGKTEEYRLNLGQVYYWLGKHKEAKKLFKKLISERQRDASVLLSVALVYRQVGEKAQARALAEEAYEKTADKRTREGAAMLRSILAADLDDRILWLERCDLSNPATKADMHSARGHKAMSEGKDQEAVREFRQSIAIYEKQRESSATLNNNALNYLAVYTVTGEREALDKGFALLERAVELKPSDSILLRNVADTMLEVTLRDCIGTALPLEKLHKKATIRMLGYLYDDVKGQKRIYQRVREHAGVKKARAYYERLLVLAPKSSAAYRSLLSIYELMNDLPALRELQTRLDKVEIEISDRQRIALDFYNGTNSEKYRKLMTNEVKRGKETLAQIRKAGAVTEAAAAAGELASDYMSLALFGGKFSPDEIVKLAEESHTAAPSTATRAVLTGALLFRASEDLRHKHPAYDALFGKSERSLNPSYQIAFLLTREGKLQQAALAHPDVRRAIELVKETSTKFPAHPSELQWAILKKTDPERAQQLAEVLVKDERQKIIRDIEQKLNRFNATLVLDSLWMGQITGDTSQALAYGREMAKRGVPLPPLQ